MEIVIRRPNKLCGGATGVEVIQPRLYRVESIEGRMPCNIRRIGWNDYYVFYGIECSGYEFKHGVLTVK